MTALEALLTILDAGGKVVPGPEWTRLLAPQAMRPLVDAHRDELRALLLARGANGEGEVLRRAKAFRRQISEWTASSQPGVPVLMLTDAPEPKFAHCVSCGSKIADAWRCPTCLAAIRVALNMAAEDASW